MTAKVVGFSFTVSLKVGAASPDQNGAYMPDLAPFQGGSPGWARFPRVETLG
jgi:hypothetical protein